MKYGEFEYQRADIVEIQKAFKVSLKKFNESTTFEDQCAIIEEINFIRDDYTSMKVLSELRKCLGVDKGFYSKELEYYNDADPMLDILVTDYYQALNKSVFKENLVKKYGTQLFNLAELKSKCISEDIVEDLKKENKMVTEYVDFTESIVGEFNGEEVGIWDFWTSINSSDRSIRKKAYESETELYRLHEEKHHDLFDRFVKLRHKMAVTMGYENFIEMGYARMNRIGYDQHMIKTFREQVLKYIVPLNNELYKRQAKRLGVDQIKYYDEPVHFNDGNAKIKVNPSSMIKTTLEMYKKLSPETSEFFKYMIDHDLFDVEKREGKEEGGFCEFIPKYKAPFIYSVTKGTLDDFVVFTHETGHAFQNYMCKDFNIPEYRRGQEDVSEIHSMSMELLIEPYLENFFGEDANKYKFSHMCNALSLLTYVMAIDEFQHFVYEHPFATYEERNNNWRALEKKYLPHRDYEDNHFLDKGSYWLRQSHVYWGPFYYIDYGLAQVSAFNFWCKAKQNKEDAWEDYLKVCRAGGSKPYIDILQVGSLKNPFEKGSIKDISETIKTWVLGLEDSLSV